MATDVRFVENLANLSEVNCLKLSARVAGRGQCGVLKTWIATEIMVHREDMITAPYLGPDRLDLLFATKEVAPNMQTLHVVDAEAQTVWLVSHQCRKCESVLRVFG